MTPKLARAILSRVLPIDVRDGILRDLDEVFERKHAADGAAAARQWYRREALSFAWRFAKDGLTPRRLVYRFSLIDVRLAARMLVKYPGLTAVGGLAIAIAIAITTVAFEITHDFSDPHLPLRGGDRIVTLQMWDGRTMQGETRLTYEMSKWQRAQSIQDLGAWAGFERNLITGKGRGALAKGAQMSAAGFRVAGTAPLLGRTLVDGDDTPGAPPVVVVGYDVWKARFGSDPAIIGKTVRFGGASRQVVGVMPDGFLFPVSHEIWVPLPALDLNSLKRFEGPSLHVFARLSPNRTLAQAERELTGLSTAEPVDPNRRGAPLKPVVQPYARGLVAPGFLSAALKIQGLLGMVFVLCCANVATLVFARTATRQSEIAVRTALGASRMRILMQFFIEALVLALLSAGVGLFAANFGIQAMQALLWSSGNARPFWWDNAIAPITFVYAGGLTVLVAAICGIVPALKSTRRDANATLQETSVRGTSARFGLASTGIIVLQVALCVALLPAALSQAWDALRARAAGQGFATAEYLAVSLSVDAPSSERHSAIYRDLATRVAQEADVLGVTFAAQFPGMSHPGSRIEIDDSRFKLNGFSVNRREMPHASVALVAPDFFAALDVRPVLGRVFQTADLGAKSAVVVVNETFARDVFGGRNPIGQRLRPFDPGDPQPWAEIIGVVPDLGMNPVHPDEAAGVYRVAAAGDPYVDMMAVHLATDPAQFETRLRSIAIAVNPGLELRSPLPLNIVSRLDQFGFRLFSFSLLAVGVMGVVLATCGIYAMMSFTVSRRTREIAIRAALGANQRRIVVAIFSRAALQVGGGATTGVAIVLLAFPRSAREIWLPLGLGLLMLVIGIFACVEPARRALRISPSDALKET